MPYSHYKDRDLAPGAIAGTYHGINTRVIEERNREAWIKVSESLPDNAFADNVKDNDDRPYRRGFSYA